MTVSTLQWFINEHTVRHWHHQLLNTLYVTHSVPARPPVIISFPTPPSTCPMDCKAEHYGSNSQVRLFGLVVSFTLTIICLQLCLTSPLVVSDEHFEGGNMRLKCVALYKKFTLGTNETFMRTKPRRPALSPPASLTTTTTTTSPLDVAGKGMSGHTQVLSFRARLH